MRVVVCDGLRDDYKPLVIHMDQELIGVLSWKRANSLHSDLLPRAS